MKFAQRAGAVVQGIVLGSLTFLAILQLIRLSGQLTVFRYEGF